MYVTIVEIDGAEGVIIPPKIMDKLGLKCGDTLELREIAGGFELYRSNGASDDVDNAMRLAMKMARTALDEIRK